jgi:ADP-dependent phosphofructokinase/glucokinase
MGLGGTVDYEISLDAGVVEDLISAWEISDSEIKKDIAILSERDLLLTLLYFVKTGTGGEQFVSNSEDLISFSNRFIKKTTLGGTCVRAAIALSYFDIKSTVHLVSISDEVRERLPESTTYLCSADQDTLDPHLIVQFPENLKITSRDIKISAPQPSRIIYTNDPPNRELLISEDVGKYLKDSAVFMISGFNCIQDSAVLHQRISDIKRHLKSAPKDCKIFYEDAGFHVFSMSQVVRDQLLSEFDVYSLNEDEMQGYIGRKVTLLDVDDVSAGLAELKKLIPARNLVVHTRFWSIVMGPEASTLQGPLQAGITMASTRYVMGDVFTPSDFDNISKSPVSALGNEFAIQMQARFGESARCIPGFELSVEKPTTIGLGDTFVGGFVGALAGVLAS